MNTRTDMNQTEVNCNEFKYMEIIINTRSIRGDELESLSVDLCCQYIDVCMYVYPVVKSTDYQLSRD